MIKIKYICLIFIFLSIILAGLSFFFAERYKYTKDDYENFKQSAAYLMSQRFVWNGIFETTFYTLHKNECGKNKTHKDYGITKSGHKAIPFRTVAVDPAYIKPGSILIDVESELIFIADDTGNGVKGYHVDIFIGEGTKTNRAIANFYNKRWRLFVVIEGGKEVYSRESFLRAFLKKEQYNELIQYLRRNKLWDQ